MRLDKFLSDSTEFSRKEIKELVKKKLVAVNGEVVTRPEMQVDEGVAVTVDGRQIGYKRFIYMIMNKPQGCVSATEDREYKTVCDILPDSYRGFGVYPAGRLDIDTEGLLILTNDGKFAHNVTSPKKNVYKRYFARVDKALEDSDIDEFSKGMAFKDFTAMPARLEICEDKQSAYVEIAEGKYHQVKRMFERVGKTVEYLRRVAIGGLILPESLGLGEVMEMTAQELEEQIFK